MTNKSIRGETHWLFLRGLAREARHWGDFASRFEAAVPGARVHALDLPGTGRRFDESAPVLISETTDLVREEFRTRVPQGAPAAVLAISLGGMLAADWLARYPGEFGAGVLINSSFAGVSSVFERLRPTALMRVLAIAGHSGSLARERAILRMISNRPEAYERLAGEWAKYTESAPLSLANAARQLIAAARFRLPAERPTCRLLVLASRADRMVNSRCSERLAQVWASTLRVHSEAGHDLPLDAPTWVAAQVGEWY